MRAQIESIRKIIGQVKSIPKEYICGESDIEPLSIITKRKTIIIYGKVVQMPEEDPLRKTAMKRIGLRLKKKEVAENNQEISARGYVVKTLSEKSSARSERSLG